MSNDDFNKFIIKGDLVTFEGHKTPLLTSLAKIQWREQITLFRETLPNAQSLMNDIIHESVEIENKKAERTPSAWLEIIQHFAKGGEQVFKDIPKNDIESVINLLSSITGIPVQKLIDLLNLPPFFKEIPPIPEPPPPPEPEPEPVKDFEKEPPPPPPVQTFGFPFTYPSGTAGKESWNWLTKKPFKITPKECRDFAHGQKIHKELTKFNAELPFLPSTIATNAYKNTVSWNLINFENRHKLKTGVFP